jgi:hypothetical protein
MRILAISYLRRPPVSVYEMVPLVRQRIYATFAQIYVLAVGTAGGVCLFNVLPLFLFRYRASVKEYQTALAVLNSPWTSQALVGALSDSRPIYEWHKRYYFIGALVVFAAALVGTGASSTITTSTVGLWFCSACLVFIVTLAEGHAANLIVFFNFEKRILPFNIGSEMLGSVFAAILVGVLARGGGQYSSYAFYIVAPLALQALWPLVAWPRESLPGDHRTENKDIALLPSENPTWFMPGSMRLQRASGSEWELVAAMSCFGVVTLIPLATESTLLYVCVAASVGAMSVTVLLRTYPCDPQFVCLCTYVMLHELFNTNIRAPIDAFYTFPDSPTCTTGGPQLDILFYFSTVSTLTGIAGVGAAWIFQRYLQSRYTVRAIVQGSIVVGMLSGLCDLSIVLGFNRALGIGDKLVFVFGDGVIAPAARLVQEMATGILAASSIKGRVTTRFAIFSSFRRLGSLQSYIFGLVLTEGMGVRADLDYGCEYSSFAKLILVAKMCMPVLAIASTYAFLPNTIPDP